MNSLTTRRSIRLASLTLAAFVTLATMAAINTLATVEAAAPQMAQAHSTQA
jgi:hypothetical protein